ncbi:MAG TPA: tryptophan synthase subunit alpha [Fimbriimonadaceae bacterium]|nr:tryptophan synthase subunit alpha [Fimbriimonadaceae bacterium]
MTSVSTHLSAIRDAGRKALVVFVTAGDQPLSDLPVIIATLEEGGADLIEIGIPFSDPYGEGLTIQASSQRSLARGTTTRAVLEVLRGVRATVPLVTMGYVNPVMRFGFASYAEAIREAGVGGAIIQDLVPEEADEWCAACKASGLETVFLAAPTSTESRIAAVCERSTGFVYAISRTGVTGAGQEAPPEVADLVTKLREKTKLPICVGFGISKAEHVKMVCRVADGAVVGSALVQLMHERWESDRGAVVEYLRGLRGA